MDVVEREFECLIYMRYGVIFTEEKGEDRWVG